MQYFTWLQRAAPQLLGKLPPQVRCLPGLASLLARASSQVQRFRALTAELCCSKHSAGVLRWPFDIQHCVLVLESAMSFGSWLLLRTRPIWAAPPFCQYPRPASAPAVRAALHAAARLGCFSATVRPALGLAGACAQACPSPALLPSWGSAELPDVTAPRWQSGTPEDAMQPGPASRQRGEPITPAAAAHHAPATPTAGRCCGAAADTCTAGAPVASVAASRPPSSVAFAEALWRRAQSFMQCVAGSPLAHSALLSLELAGTHPAVPQGSGLPSGQALQWTLAQLLAMHLKSGLPQGASTAPAAANNEM